MSFGSPGFLLALLALPLLAAWYLAEQRRRQAAANAFAAPRLQRSVAPSPPGWRRHAPYVVLALALAALVAAAAKPQRTVAVPAEQASIVLATDVSGSMTATDVRPSRLDAVQRAAHAFVDEVPRRVNVGVLAFNATPTLLQSPTTDRAAVRSAIDALHPSGGTATGEAILNAVSAVRRGGKRPPAAVVLLSDGASASGRDPVAAARAARRAKVPVYTVTLGTEQGTILVERRDGSTETRPVPPDPESLAEIARASGGKSFTADTAGGLKDVYERLGSQLGRKEEKRQLTSAFAGGALALLLGGVAMSLGWFGRLV